MSALVIAVLVVGIILGLAAGYWLPPNGRLTRKTRPRQVRRILLPFSGHSISRRSFEAAVRLAKAENATIMPAYLVIVPMGMSLEAALPEQCTEGMPLLEVIEQRANAQGARVESRVSRGRSYRNALQRLLAEESFDRIIVSVNDSTKLEDLEWLFHRVPTEILALQPAPDDPHRLSAEETAWYL